MLDKLYITPRQWMHILRWSLYSLLLLTAMLVQTVVLGNHTLFGAKPDFVPVVITCVCLREGAERGGLFALLGSIFWALSGADMGSVYIIVLTILPILGSLFFKRFLFSRYFPCLLLCFLTLFVQHSATFLLKFLYESIDSSLYFSRLIPCVLVSLLAQPLCYWLVKCIEKIGDAYEST